MTPWKQRLTGKLEPILHERDPGPRLSRYDEMPFAIFVYPPQDEFKVREQLALLRTRLTQAGKRVTTISLAACLDEALAAEGLDAAVLAEAERDSGLELAIETVANVLSDYQPLDSLVASKVPVDADPCRDVVFLVRAGALFPVYRTSALLEHLKGHVKVPVVLFYPGEASGPVGLQFMGVMDPEHHYRGEIF